MSVRVLEGGLEAGDLRIAIVAAQFNGFVVDRLIEGAIETLKRHGIGEAGMDLVRVPGAFELPVAVARLLTGKRHSAVIALGCIVRGETSHFDFVAGECTRGLGRLALDSGIPIAFGVLTTDTVEQALARAHTDSSPPLPLQGERVGVRGKDIHSNKGAEAAECALRMANLLRRLED